MTGNTRAQSLTVNGRRVEVGTELSISGVRGRFRFRSVDTFTDGRPTVVTVVGGTDGHSMTRTFTADRIRTVHRIAKARPA